MVKAGKPVDAVIEELKPLLEPGDILIDGGNSLFTDTERRVAYLKPTGIRFFGMGVSGGEEGALWGPSMMPGGDEESYKHLEPILTKVAAKSDSGPCVAYLGSGGSGHFVKMVHNGIEYGMMQAYGEGFEVLYKSPFPLDLHQISSVWNRGSVVRSWLLELAERAFETQPTLAGVEPYVEDSGEGRWTIQAAIEENVAVPVIAASLFARFASRDPYNLSARFAAALRNQFGGHEIRKATESHLSSKGEIDK
jgi:6-phosphogluconate dehydrogenase